MTDITPPRPPRTGAEGGRQEPVTDGLYSRVIARIRQKQSLFRLAFDDRRVTRTMLRAQAEEFERWLAMLDPAPSAKRVIVGELDEAWRAAEAALPKGWRFIRLEYEPAHDYGPPVGIVSGWHAVAQSDPFRSPYREEHQRGPTPAAAFQALAQALGGHDAPD